MPSLLSALSGLSGSNGLPFTLTDEEQAALQAQQADPSQGMSTLTGTTGPDSTSTQAAPVSDAIHQSLLDQLSQVKDSTNADGAAPSSSQYSTDTETPIAAATGEPDVTVPDDTTSADSTSATTTASPDNSATSPSDPRASDTSASSDSSSGGGLFSHLGKLGTDMKNNPDLGMALMNSGFSMMGAAGQGLNPWAAIGSGAQYGVQYYNNLKQQRAATELAKYQAQNKALMDDADIKAKNATTQTTVLNNQQTQARQGIYQKIASGAVSPNDPSVKAALASTGMKPEDIVATAQGWSPKLGTPREYMDPQTGIQMVQDRTENGTPVGTPYAKAVAPTQVSAGSSLVNTQSANGPAAGGNMAPTLTPDQQKAVNEESDAAAAAKTKAETMQQAAQILSDPEYQKAASSGVAGAVESYIRQKYGYFTGDPTQLVNNALQQEMIAKNLGTVMSAMPGGKLDKPTQEAINNNNLDVNKISPQMRAQMANMLASGYTDQASQASRKAQWDQAGLGAAAMGNTTLRDGTAVKQGMTRDSFVTAKNSKNPLAQPQTAPQNNALASMSRQDKINALITNAKNGDAAAAAYLKQNNVKF
ncbi:hypothetical protein [Caballeronia zhejiangensis]|uniref:hypothetical protein n=1 Tax=Caballeronia zhejiangensis TaxID=871203 RepID=UPI001F529F16|nr:hypothetical protein [Caballeronia zhejiangensis]MCI1046919.1 hypothetical protein [Caballeronia zhejiangensis]